MQYLKRLIMGLLWLPAAIGAVEPQTLLDRVNARQSLEPLFQALDSRALASAVDADARVASVLEQLKPRLRGGQLRGAALAGEAAAVTLRLEFAGDELNYLALQYNDRDQLAGWYDYALGVSLAELVRAMRALGDNKARNWLQRLEERPLQALGELPDSRTGRILSRLVLAACSGSACYTRTLAQMQPLEPRHASLWRYEQAVQQQDDDQARQALRALRAELGRDPGLAWLDYAHALARGRCSAVRADLEQALQRWPGYRKLYPMAAQCAARARDWKATTRWLRALEERFGEQLDHDALAEHPVYGDYVDSDSYQDWRGDGG